MFKKKTLLFASLVVLLASCQKETCPPETKPPVKDSLPIVKDTLPNYENSLKDSLWAYYPLNNDLLDKSGNNRILSVRNGLGLSNDMWGKSNSCLMFDGSDDFAVIDDGRNFPTGNFTVAMKFTSPTLQGRLFQKADFTNARGASFGLGFAFPGGNFLHYAISKDVNICSSFTSASTLNLMRSPDLLSDAWYHVVIVHDNGIQKMYINGQLIGNQRTDLPRFTNCTTAPFYFGIWWLQDLNAFRGKIDDIRIYTKALKGEEITYLSKCSMN